jgi:hypothetical protein
MLVSLILKIVPFACHIGLVDCSITPPSTPVSPGAGGH